MIKVGLILYSVRDEMAKDPLGTVEKVGKLGYKNIEVSNHNAMNDPGIGFGVDAKTIKAAFDKVGCKVVSAHVHPYIQADVPAVIAYNKVLENTNIINPMGYFTTYDDLMRQCEVFNEQGRVCREAGLNYLYHNHHHEYRTFGGKTIMDYLLENTDPNYFSLELDTFWVMRAGVSPVEELKRLGKRVKLVHQKDFAWDSMVPINTIGTTPEEREMKLGESVGSATPPPKVVTMDEAMRLRLTSYAEIGTGIMPIQEIIDTANEYTDATYIILEQDFTRMSSQFDSVEKSMEAFKKFEGISWDN